MTHAGRSWPSAAVALWPCLIIPPSRVVGLADVCNFLRVQKYVLTKKVRIDLHFCIS